VQPVFTRGVRPGAVSCTQLPIRKEKALEILLTKSTTPIIGWVAQLLGWIMNGIYSGLAYLNLHLFHNQMTVFGETVSYANIGLTIILFTIIVYIAMTPLQVRQQKSSKMMSAMQPELTKIQDKYKGRTDSDSRMRMQQEIQELYGKYGISMSGSCVTLLIQFPILFALYQVIYRIPAYISSVGNIFQVLAGQIASTANYSETLTNFVKEAGVRVSLGDSISTNKIVDVLYLLKPNQWKLLASNDYFSSLSSNISETSRFSQTINNFAGLNISQSPWDVIKQSISSHAWLLLLAAILVPVLAWFTQWLTMKLMPQASNQDDRANATANTMQSMNLVMPIFSAFMCVTLSFGIGIYWIAGAVIRCIQQVIINRKMMKLDVNVMIAQARAKAEKKEEKRGGVTRAGANSTVTRAAHASTRRIEDPRFKDLDKKEVHYEEAAREADPNSITAKANMVARFDEEHGRKKSGGANRRKNGKRSGQNRSGRPGASSERTDDRTDDRTDSNADRKAEEKAEATASSDPAGNDSAEMK
jgi:YidC/Oxa1 family membrane protein insertase